MARDGEDPARVAESRPHWHMLRLMDGSRTQSFLDSHLETAKKPWRQQAGGGVAHHCEWSGAGDPRFPCVRQGGAMVWRNGPDSDEAYGLLVP